MESDCYVSVTCCVSDARFPRGSFLVVLAWGTEARDVNNRASQEEVCSLVGGCRAEKNERSFES